MPAPRPRPLGPDDDLEGLTALIHRAHAPLAAQGLRSWATHQIVADTRERCGRGETWLAEAGGQGVGAALMDHVERRAQALGATDTPPSQPSDSATSAGLSAWQARARRAPSARPRRWRDRGRAGRW